MSILEFEIPGSLKAKQRPRMTRRGHAYTPKETVNAEAYVREFFANTFFTHRPFDGPVAVEIEFYRCGPVSWSKWKQEACNNGTYYDVTGSDIDNKAKTVLDALNKVAYRDDRQICSLVLKKCFSDREYTYVRIQEYKQPEIPKNNVNRGNQVNIKGGQPTFREKMIQKSKLGRISGLKSSGGVYAGKR